MPRNSKPAWLLAGLLAASAILPFSGATAQQKALVLEGGTLIDGTGRAPITDALVVVEGGRIKAVGRRGQLAIPAGAEVINTEGRTILPGLIDIHVHSHEWHMPMFIHYGVTTMADLSTDMSWILAERAALKSGKINGPRMFIAGTYIWGPLKPSCDGNTPPYHLADGRPSGTCVGGTFNTRAVGTAEETRAYIRKLIGEGVDILKTDETLTDEQFKVIVAESKRTGIPAIGHTQNLLRAVRLGFKFDEHMDTMARSILDPDEKIEPKDYMPRGGPIDPLVTLESRLDPKTLPPLIDELVKNGVFVNPTLVGGWSAASPRGQEWAEDAKEMIKDPGLAFVPEDVRQRWTAPAGKARAGYDKIVTFLKMFTDKGGKIVIGTDSSAGQTTIPGLSEHHEMQMFADMGIAPMKVLQAATLWNAQAIKKDKDLGSVEPGKIADFTIIEGDPLKDISVTKNVRMVIKEGKVLNTAYDPKWVNPIPEPYSVFSNTPPRIAKAAPGEGGTLEIDGSGFTKDAVVHLDRQALPTKFVSAKKLTATLAPGTAPKAAGDHVVYVVNPGHYGTVSTPAHVAVDASGKLAAAAAPTSPQANIFGVSPRMAPQDGKGVTVTIEGINFAPNAVIQFDGVDLPTKYVSPTRMTAQLDASFLHRAPGFYSLYVVKPGLDGSVSIPGYFGVNLK